MSIISTNQRFTKWSHTFKYFQPIGWVRQQVTNKKVLNVSVTQGQVWMSLPITTYKRVNPSEFDREDKPIDGYGKDRAILKDYNSNSIQQYGISYCRQIEKPVLESCLLHCRGKRTHTTRIEHTKKDGHLHKVPWSHSGYNWHPLKTSQPV